MKIIDGLESASFANTHIRPWSLKTSGPFWKAREPSQAAPISTSFRSISFKLKEQGNLFLVVHFNQKSLTSLKWDLNGNSPVRMDMSWSFQLWGHNLCQVHE